MAESRGPIIGTSSGQAAGQRTHTRRAARHRLPRMTLRTPLSNSRRSVYVSRSSFVPTAHVSLSSLYSAIFDVMLRRDLGRGGGTTQPSVTRARGAGARPDRAEDQIGVHSPRLADCLSPRATSGRT